MIREHRRRSRLGVYTPPPGDAPPPGLIWGALALTGGAVLACAVLPYALTLALSLLARAGG